MRLKSAAVATACLSPLLAVTPSGDANASTYAGARLDELPQRFVIAHRGAGAFLAPENTTAAFDRGVADPNSHMLEFDVQVLKDGAGAVWHDPTVDRISTSTGPVTSLDSAAFKKLVIDPRSWFGGTAANTNPLLLNELLDRYAGRKLLLAHPKDTAAMRLTIDTLKERGLQDSVHIQTFSRSDAVLAHQAGFTTQVIVGGAQQAAIDTPEAIKADGIDRVSLWQGLPDATIKGYVAAGLVVTCYDVNRHYRRDQLYALGVRGLDSDDPTYARGDQARYRRTGDPFATQNWWYGHLGQVQAANRLAANHPDRGSFTAPDSWGVPRGSYPMFVRQGWASPVPKIYELRVWMKVTALGSDKTRWGGVYFSANRDHAFTDAATDPHNAGYNLILRQNGQLQLYRKEPSRTVLLKTINTKALGTGTLAKLQIKVTTTGIYIRRYDITSAGATVNDTKYRGGYLYFGRSAYTNQQGPGITFKSVYK
ncbi:glycerophosphodiester phosphodiesterase [Actinomadura viridis]|uniref:Glycerophosphoryl diester phosphodiesterase n=1 Tax=Actinomadura viridis TaxID=58110 RepID=A0A931DKF2_9ACTN|nr:glycerophosphodiester phosphodiesterase family protein [Actinomadura viridis]MBG6091645.1 glycerophosphoryl diester phosphodiesterase [Actinomadura viridis]